MTLCLLYVCLVNVYTSSKRFSLIQYFAQLVSSLTFRRTYKHTERTLAHSGTKYDIVRNGSTYHIHKFTHLQVLYESKKITQHKQQQQQNSEKYSKCVNYFYQNLKRKVKRSNNNKKEQSSESVCMLKSKRLCTNKRTKKNRTSTQKTESTLSQRIRRQVYRAFPLLPLPKCTAALFHFNC